MVQSCNKTTIEFTLQRVNSIVILLHDTYAITPIDSFFILLNAY